MSLWMTRYNKDNWMDEVFDFAFPSTRKTTSNISPFRPGVDVSSTDFSVEITLDAPGYDTGDIDLSIKDGVLTIQGRKTTEKADSGKTYHIQERASQTFSRSFTLGEELDENNVKATLSKGVLRVEIKKVPQLKEQPARRILVEKC